jgi:hypothetical protein
MSITDRRNKMQGRIKRQNKGGKRLPILGKVKVGIKDPQRGFPRSLDYFRPTGKYVSRFSQVFGEQPKSIIITFVDDNPEYSCNELFEFRGKKDGKLYGHSDGEQYFWYDIDKGKFGQCERAVAVNAVKTGAVVCSTVLRLRFVIPQLKGLLGVWQLETKAEKSSIGQIRDAFDFVLENAGTVKGVPFTLNVEKVKSQLPSEDGKTSTFPVITLVPDISTENADALRGYLEQGNSIKGLSLLTDEKLSTIKHVEYKEVANG